MKIKTIKVSIQIDGAEVCSNIVETMQGIDHFVVPHVAMGLQAQLQIKAKEFLDHWVSEQDKLDA